MIKLENTEVVGIDHAICGMRNPLESWDQSDSHPCDDMHCNREGCAYYDTGCNDVAYRDLMVGLKDQDLAMRLRNAGTDHRKFMRMITVYCDITAPLYWWKEFDTYKVGTVANSCSTMHTIHKKEFDISDFSHEHLVNDDYDGNNDRRFLDILDRTIDALNEARASYLETKDKQYWWQMIQLLPTSYNQKRTVMLNYEVLASIYKSRRNHKLDEWRELCKRIEGLPYSKLITGKNPQKLAFADQPGLALGA